MPIYTKLVIPEGSVTVAWVDGKGWKVQLPGAEGFTYYPADKPESGQGLAGLREAVLGAMEYAEYHNRPVSIGASEDLVELVMGNDFGRLQRMPWTTR